MTYTLLFITILCTHWVADFVLQTDKQAKAKSKNFLQLISHTGVYSLVWLFVLLILCGYGIMGAQNSVDILLFALITWASHTLIDFITSKINSSLWTKGQVHNFFVSIGLDQVLHYIQLWFTFLFLFT